MKDVSVILKRQSRQFCLIALIALPFSSSLQAGWLDSLSNNRVGQWFLNQPKAIQVGVSIGALAAVTATVYAGYRYLTNLVAPRFTAQSIDLSEIVFDELMPYKFGADSRMNELDLKTLANILNAGAYNFCREDARASSPHLKVTAEELELMLQSGIIDLRLGSNQRASKVEVFMLRDKQNKAFIGFYMISKIQGTHKLNRIDTKRNLTLWAINESYRGQGCEELLLAHAYRKLKDEDISMKIIAQEGDSMIGLYDAFIGFRRERVCKTYKRQEGEPFFQGPTWLHYEGPGQSSI